MKNFDPEFYSISVRKEFMDGELLYVARIQEFPDVMEFADSYEEARELALDTIQTSYELCIDEDIPFPEPSNFNHAQASGRVTLRMPKSLHSMLIKRAEDEEVSLNQYIVSALSMNYGQCSTIERVTQQISSSLAHITSRVVEIKRDVRGFAQATHAIEHQYGASRLGGLESFIKASGQTMDVFKDDSVLDADTLCISRDVRATSSFPLWTITHR